MRRWPTAILLITFFLPGCSSITDFPRFRGPQEDAAAATGDAAIGDASPTDAAR